MKIKNIINFKYFKYIVIIVLLLAIFCYTNTIKSTQVKYYFVKINGAVLHPGTFKLKQGEIIASAIKKAQLKNNADINKVNFSQKNIKNLYIPYKKVEKNYQDNKIPSIKIYINEKVTNEAPHVTNYSTTRLYNTYYTTNSKSNGYYKNNEQKSTSDLKRSKEDNLVSKTTKSNYKIEYNKNKDQNVSKQNLVKIGNDKLIEILQKDLKDGMYIKYLKDGLNKLNSKEPKKDNMQININIKNEQAKPTSNTVSNSFNKPGTNNITPNVPLQSNYNYNPPNTLWRPNTWYNQANQNQITQNKPINTKPQNTQPPKKETNYGNKNAYFCQKFEDKIAKNNKVGPSPNYINLNDFLLEPQNKKAQRTYHKFIDLYEKYTNRPKPYLYDVIGRYVFHQQNHKINHFCDIYLNNLLEAPDDYEIISNFAQIY